MLVVIDLYYITEESQLYHHILHNNLNQLNQKLYCVLCLLKKHKFTLEK